MIGYPYIQNLFQTILSKSMVIGGRFYVCPKWGAELNNPNIDESIAIGQANGQKYPGAFLMPPPKDGNFEYSGDLGGGNNLWSSYSINILFLGGAKNTGANQPSQANKIGISTHTIADMWHDMDRVAENFCVVLQGMIQKLGGNITFGDDIKPKITPITDFGSDKVSGVKLTFRLYLYGGCVVEDYPIDWKNSIVPPDINIDIHPLHTNV